MVHAVRGGPHTAKFPKILLAFLAPLVLEKRDRPSGFGQPGGDLGPGGVLYTD